MSSQAKMPIRAIEAAWLQASSDPEPIYFSAFKDPQLLRRSLVHTGALAALSFGCYKGMDGEVVSDPRFVWLGMIVSERGDGEGSRFLDYLVKLVRTHGAAMVGEPIALSLKHAKPRSYPALAGDDLVSWYRRHGAHVVQDSRQTIVVWPPIGGIVHANFELIRPEPSKEGST